MIGSTHYAIAGTQGTSSNGENMVVVLTRCDRVVDSSSRFNAHGHTDTGPADCIDCPDCLASIGSARADDIRVHVFIDGDLRR